MALDLKFSAALRAAQQDAITAKMGANSVIKIYSGLKPASPDNAVTNQVLLCTLACSTTFAPPAVGSTLTVNPIEIGVGTEAAGTGTEATWFRIETASGVGHIDGTVGISGADMNLNNTNIAKAQTISVATMKLINGNDS